MISLLYLEVQHYMQQKIINQIYGIVMRQADGYLIYITKKKKKFRGIKKLSFILIANVLRTLDRASVKHINLIATNSDNVAERVKKFYNRKSIVIKPFVSLKEFKFIKTGDFYLSTGRLDPFKRIDIIVRAFQQMPDKNLIIAGGGPDEDRIKTMIKNSKNIEYKGNLDTKELAHLYGTCLATVFASLHEDFGMVAIESMAAGKPVIAPGDKGFAESVIHNKTGILYDGKLEKLIKAVKRLDRNKSIKMRGTCEERAKEFSEEIFMSKLKEAINKAVKLQISNQTY